MKKALIIGSGIGGLATPVRLAVKGYAVEVFEASDHPGGKLSEKNLGGFRFDTGPSLFTLPALVDELFLLAGKDPAQHFSYTRIPESCRYFWEDGFRLAAGSQPEDFAAACAKTFSVPAEDILRYFAECKSMYDLTEGVFLERSLHRAKNYLRKDVLRGVMNAWRLHLFRTMHQVHRKRMKSPHLVQLFDRFATYNGSDPYQAPGILSMIPHLEHNLGTFFPKGGMIDIPNVIYKLALELGVKFHFNAPVETIITQNKKASGIRVNGKEITGDVVISNMDVVPTYRRLLPNEKAPEKSLQQERSSSALIFYWGISRQFPELGLHNIFFSADYEKEFRMLFKENSVTDDPTVYIHISSKYCKTDAPDGKENWFILVNVPGNNGQDWDALIPQIRANTIAKLSRMLNTDVASLIEQEDRWEPRTIERDTFSYQGSLYGSASNNRYAAFLRHPNFSRRIPNLYFCGGSVHPGGGIPLCLRSAKIAADLILEDQSL